jgi:xanthine dehydrogenase accessory factor
MSLLLPKRRSLLADDDVMGDFILWQAAGRRTALISLISIDGTTPRPLGAQMAVADNGAFTGYMSGGCIEQSIAQDAVQAIAERRNRMVRYGKGSAYFDLQLPCGSGLDFYIDQSLPPTLVARVASFRDARQPFVQTTNLTSGSTTFEALDGEAGTALHGDAFSKVHLPLPRIVLIGGGPALMAIAHLIAAAGLDLHIVSPDEAVCAEAVAAGLSVHKLIQPQDIAATQIDRFTATVVAFHEHDWEAPVLSEVLRSPSFYIGVMGSRRAHQNRVQQLSDMGVSPRQMARLRSPIGLVPGAKSRATLAAGILAEVMSEAKAAGLLA